MSKRKHDRVQIDAPGCYRSARGMRWEVKFSDLSEGGCRVEDPSVSLSPGEEVRAFIAGTGPHLANVAWCADGMAGLAFVRPLPQRVFTLLASKQFEKAVEAHANPNASEVKRFV